ncbi:hypothetical protein [Siphonobacter sp. SORGH_AS_0500]|uniref:hypothetical protein n=1 Tax=Siphonobacter sp. SORGH_AS_0500 TaxID=1864824 RepID=UPI00285B4579|nr:hypothetical protein [Siphonobacter sp. SORGH_AS_0500]MDR6196149.1 hypothetical protein [Siphonobacter sp. SORGH_AS_0500]
MEKVIVNNREIFVKFDYEGKDSDENPSECPAFQANGENLDYIGTYNEITKQLTLENPEQKRSEIHNTDRGGKIAPGVVLEITANSEKEAITLVEIYLDANISSLRWNPQIPEKNGVYYFTLAEQ